MSRRWKWKRKNRKSGKKLRIIYETDGIDIPAAPKYKNHRPAVQQETIPGAYNDYQERARLRNKRKRQRRKERRAQKREAERAAVVASGDDLQEGGGILERILAYCCCCCRPPMP